jgi:hypothetical protein
MLNVLLFMLLFHLTHFNVQGFKCFKLHMPTGRLNLFENVHFNFISYIPFLLHGAKLYRNGYLVLKLFSSCARNRNFVLKLFSSCASWYFNPSPLVHIYFKMMQSSRFTAANILKMFISVDQKLAKLHYCGHLWKEM